VSDSSIFCLSLTWVAYVRVVHWPDSVQIGWLGPFSVRQMPPRRWWYSPENHGFLGRHALSPYQTVPCPGRGEALAAPSSPAARPAAWAPVRTGCGQSWRRSRSTT